MHVHARGMDELNYRGHVTQSNKSARVVIILSENRIQFVTMLVTGTKKPQEFPNVATPRRYVWSGGSFTWREMLSELLGTVCKLFRDCPVGRRGGLTCRWKQSELTGPVWRLSKDCQEPLKGCVWQAWPQHGQAGRRMARLGHVGEGALGGRSPTSKPCQGGQGNQSGQGGQDTGRSRRPRRSGRPT